MKYIRTYGDYNSWKLDYSDTSRGFRLKPTLYKYSDTGVESKILLETDDPRKHGDSTYIEINLSSDDLIYNDELILYIDNKPGDTQTTMTCTIDWGDGTVETKTITRFEDDYGHKGFKLSHNYKAGSYRVELYNVERDYIIEGTSHFSGGSFYYESLISHPSSVKRVILSSSVDSIGNGMFGQCSSLTSVHIPEGITSIGDYAFQDCASLTSLYIPEGVTSIGEHAFSNAWRDDSSLKSIYIPESVNSIGSSAFSYCISLTSVHIPEGVTKIGDSMFYNCSSLNTIFSLNTTAPTLGDYVFEELPTNGTLYIKPGATGYDAWLSKLPSGWKIVESL